jgi:hypothetical protein
MRPINQTVVGAVNGAPAVLDYRQTPFQVSVFGSVVSGSVNFKLQYTYDDPFTAPFLVNWIDHGLMTGKTAAFDTVLNAAPVTAVRVVNSGTGTVGVRIVQGGE